MNAAKQTTVDTSLLQRMFWDAWEIAKGRQRTLKDIHDPANKSAVRTFTDKYLPEIRRARDSKKRQTS